MRESRSAGIVAAAAAAFALMTGGIALPAHAQGVALGVKGGTTGIGLDVTVGVAPILNVRGSGSLFSLSRTMTQSDVKYDAKAELKNAMLLLDLHPSGGNFRISAGAVYNGTKLSGTSVGGTVELNGTTYNVNDVGRIDGEATANKLCPYLGLGFGNAVKAGARVRFVLDVGVFYSGSPKVSLTAHPTNPALVPAGFYQNLEAERRKVQDDASSYKYYPVISMGISVRL